MKNINPRQHQNDSLDISVSVNDILLLQNLVEKLALRNNRMDAHEMVPEGWMAIDASSIEAYVSGIIEMNTGHEHIALAYTTCFSYTCTKLANEENTLTWGNSLS